MNKKGEEKEKGKREKERKIKAREIGGVCDPGRSDLGTDKHLCAETVTLGTDEGSGLLRSSQRSGQSG